MTEDWTKWESLVINGAYPLRRFLARSDHSVVFLTENTINTPSKAAIKLIPEDPASSQAQLAYWNAVIALSHPHLIGLYDTGRCQLGGHPFLFVVMEYAEQTLAQILPSRALTLDEVQELLAPTLDTLRFLHGRNLVHGRLKPSNFLVVNDQLKLASDGVRPAQARDSSVTPAGDIRALGATIVEALTQHPPDDGSGTVALPDALPTAFTDTVRRCLSSNPADRPTIANLGAQFKGAPPMPSVAPQPHSVATAPSAVTVAAPPRAQSFAPTAPAAPAVDSPTMPGRPTPGQRMPGRPIPGRPTPRNRLLVPASAAVLILVAIAWAASHLLQGQPHSPKPASVTAPSVTPPAATSPANRMATPAVISPTSTTSADTTAPTQVPTTATDVSGLPGSMPAAIVHQEIPAISRRARASIRGTIKVTIRVTVDRAGKVVSQGMENRGSSQYFARVAGEAAKKWRFAPDGQDSRQWLLQFEFTRSGTAAHATARLGQHG